MALQEPWRAVASDDERLAAELQREVGPGHVLFGKNVRVIARRFDRDDVLCEVEGTVPSFAVVHLTWTGKRDLDPGFPRTTLYRSLADWEALGAL